MRKRVLILASIFALAALLTVQVEAKEITVRGNLKRTVEAGGWLIQTRSEKYLILNARRFQDEAWFQEGTRVEATGETKPDVVTTSQEGVPFDARLLARVSDKSDATAGDSPQAASEKRSVRVLVTGNSIVRAQPDTATLIISVVTQNRQALSAQQENAARSDAVIRTLKTAAGAGAEIKTSGYSIEPQRVYKENQPPTITGYEARNLITVTMGDLTKVGTVIDAATRAGANNIESVSFTLRKDRPAKDEALAEATREAIAKAQVLAQALGGRVARIVEVQEAGANVRPIYDAEYGKQRVAMAAGATSTPIEVGTLDITSQVQLIAEVE